MVYDTGVAIVIGFHVFRSVWEPKKIPALSYLHEVHNMYEVLAIKTCLKDERAKEQIVRHLPIKISHLTKYMLVEVRL